MQILKAFDRFGQMSFFAVGRIDGDGAQLGIAIQKGNGVFEQRDSFVFLVGLDGIFDLLDGGL